MLKTSFSSTWLLLTLVGLPGVAVAEDASASRLPVRPGGACGTLPILNELVVDGLPEARFQGSDAPAGPAAKAACTSNPRPTYDEEQLYTDEEYGFVIHYTEDSSDPRAVSYDDVLATAEIMREVMDVELDEMGYLRPPDDTPDAEVYCDTGAGADGGNGYYDVYFVAEDNVYGYAQPMTYVDSGRQKASSFLALSTWILDYDGALEVTVAHEFFHAIHFTYDVYENSFWMENSAVWMEEQVYDEVDDYLNYVPEAFRKPYTALDTKGTIQYAHGIWPLFMSQEHGRDVVQDMWNECKAVKGANALKAQKAVLDPLHDGGWKQAVLDFRAAMYDTSRFEEGDEYPAVTAYDVVQVKTGTPTERSGEVAHTGAHIIVFQTLTPGSLSLCVKGDDGDTIAKAFKRTLSGKTEVELDGSPSDGSIEIADFGTSTSQVALVISHAALSGEGGYTYQAVMGGDACKIGDGTGGGEDTPTPEPTEAEETPTPDDAGGDPMDDDEEPLFSCSTAGAGQAGSAGTLALLAAGLLLRSRRRARR